MKKIIVFAVVLCIMISTISFAGENSSKGSIGKYAGPIGTAKDVVEGVYDVYKADESEKIERVVETAAKVSITTAAEAVAVPAAVATASSLGVTASTGTAISALRGAAATSATLAAIGGPAAAALGAVGIVAAPAVIGGVIVVGTGTAIAAGINWLLFDDDEKK